MDNTTSPQGEPTAAPPQPPVQVQLFDPPLCCPTGLCGPTLDQTLLDVNEMVQALTSEGVGIERYQMASHPHIFLKHRDVMRLVRERGMEAFPITVVAGRVIKTGAYPSREEIEQNRFEAAEVAGIAGAGEANVAKESK